VFLPSLFRILPSSLWHKVRKSPYRPIRYSEHEVGQWTNVRWLRFTPFLCIFILRTQKYIEALTAKTKPKKILVCTLYYPDENNTPSWANAALGALGYNTNPAKIQLLLRKIFEECTSSVRIPGSQVVPIPLFHPLDGTRSEDYVARVEPSASGGRKMAEYMLDVIHGSGGSVDTRGMGKSSSLAPSTSFIDGRAT